MYSRAHVILTFHSLGAILFPSRHCLSGGQQRQDWWHQVTVRSKTTTAKRRDDVYYRNVSYKCDTVILPSPYCTTTPHTELTSTAGRMILRRILDLPLHCRLSTALANACVTSLSTKMLRITPREPAMQATLTFCRPWSCCRHGILCLLDTIHVVASPYGITRINLTLSVTNTVPNLPTAITDIHSHS
jgi:hypothetical protein